MNNQILFVTEHLSKLLNDKQLQCLEIACKVTDFEFIPNIISTESFKEAPDKHLLLASEECLISMIDKHNYVPKENLILFITHKDDLQLEKYKEKITAIRFILGDPPVPLLEIIITHTLNFFKNRNNHNISVNFSPQNSISLSWQLKNSKERDEMQSKISEFFKQQIEKNKSNLIAGAVIYAKNLSDILEEFLMNAIWDANPKYASVDRTQPIQLLENEKISIFCLFDGINLVLSVADPFGSFSSSAIQKYIQYSLGITKDKTIHEGVGGAGIGLYMILQKIGVLVFEVEKGKLTRATAIARGDQSIREMQKKSRTLLFYEK